MIGQAEAESVVAGLQDAWNAADGGRFASLFADDADFVTVAGMHATGREAIAENHDRIFRTVYKGSRVAMHVAKLRPLAADLAIMHIGVTLQVPEGPLAGSMDALMTTVIRNDNGHLEIVALQNTIARDLNQAAGRPDNGKEVKS